MVFWFSLTMTPFRYLCVYGVISTCLASTSYETCKLRNGEQGYCRSVLECESAKAELKSKTKPQTCGYDKLIPIVCCSDVLRNEVDVVSDDYEEINENDRLELIFDNGSKDATSGDSSIVDSIDDFNTLRFPNANNDDNESPIPDDNINGNKSVEVQPEITFLNKNLSEYSHLSHGAIKFDGPVTNVLKIPLKRWPFRFPDHSNNKTPQKSVISDRFETPSRNSTTSNRDESERSEDGGSKGRAQKECDQIIEYGKQFVPRTRYITGGKNADHFEFPHMAALGYETKQGNMDWKCGGSLINDRFVVTAAHCTHTSNGPVKIVRLGDIDTADDPGDNEVQSVGVAKIFVHPSYNPPYHYHDIALLQLEKPVNYSRAVMPACLQDSYDFGNTTLWATGWGTLYYGGQSSNILQKVDLRLFSTNECSKKAYGRQRRLADGVVDQMQICAGNPEQGKDTCQGDSGGPLQIKILDHFNIYKIVGITSFGIKCGIIEGIYTRVSYYLPWIEEIVWSKLE